MSVYHSHLSTAVKLVESFTNEAPFSIYLKNFFSINKKYGSRDRKNIASLCFNYYRVVNGAIGGTTLDTMLMGYFLCEKEPCEMLEKMNPFWNRHISDSISKKTSLLDGLFDTDKIFHLPVELSEGIDIARFNLSFLQQPNVFIRLRPRNYLGARKKLEKIKVPYRCLNDYCVEVPPSINIENVFTVDKDIVIQDFSSQQVFDYFKEEAVVPAMANGDIINVWDCCAASGGKSILITDILGQRINLTVSDIRPSVIMNLHKRFGRAGIKSYNYFIADLMHAHSEYPISSQQLIICDVPCSGSGTWGRCPEQLSFFSAKQIFDYSQRQRRIVENVLPYLQDGGMIAYITCSVFKEENEENVEHICKAFGLKLLSRKLLAGYEMKADSMFTAILQK